MSLFVSIIIPCRNEEHFIGNLIGQLLKQDYPADQMEIIFLDGRSTDKTREIIQSFVSQHPFMMLIDNPEAVVPHALNEGIKKSKGELIIRMDAHAGYPDNYISQLVFWQQQLNADNVGGMWITKPGADTPWARSIALALSHPFGIGNARYRLGANAPVEVDTVPYGCYKKDVFSRIGFFDEQLVRNQDDEFNARLKKNGGKIFLIPSIRIEYFARPKLSQLSAMYYQYGLFKPLVNIKLGYPSTARQLAPLALVLSLAITGLMALLFPSSSWLFFLNVSFYLLADLVFSFQLALKKGFWFIPYLLVIFPVIHFSYGTGYLAGILQFVVLRKHEKGESLSADITR